MPLHDREQGILDAVGAELAASEMDFDPVVLNSNALLKAPDDIRRAILVNANRGDLEGDRLQKAERFLERLVEVAYPVEIVDSLPIAQGPGNTVNTYLVFPTQEPLDG
jgi:hypothetical protein